MSLNYLDLQRIYRQFSETFAQQAKDLADMHAIIFGDELPEEVRSIGPLIATAAIELGKYYSLTPDDYTKLAHLTQHYMMDAVKLIRKNQQNRN